MESTLRVELEGSGIIGFISVTNDTMLVEARALIDDELDDVPPSYIFLLDGSVPLGHKQEKKKTCQQFLPTIVIRPTSSAAPAAAAAPAASPFAAAAPVAAAAPAAPSASDLNREKLMRFYKKYNPGKVDTVDAILRRFQGEEDAMFQKLYTKYNLDARGQPLNSAALKQKVRDDKKKAVKEAALIKAGKETGHSYMDDPEEAVYPSVMQGVKDIYRQMIAPVEKMYLFDQFYSPILQDSDFDAKPMLLMLGQYRCVCVVCGVQRTLLRACTNVACMLRVCCAVFALRGNLPSHHHLPSPQPHLLHPASPPPLLSSSSSPPVRARRRSSSTFWSAISLGSGSVPSPRRTASWQSCTAKRSGRPRVTPLQSRLTSRSPH